MPELRDQKIEVQLTAKEKRKLKRLAKTERLSMSEFVRKQVFIP